MQLGITPYYSFKLLIMSGIAFKSLIDAGALEFSLKLDKDSNHEIDQTGKFVRLHDDSWGYKPNIAKAIKAGQVEFKDDNTLVINAGFDSFVNPDGVRMFGKPGNFEGPKLA